MSFFEQELIIYKFSIVLIFKCPSYSSAMGTTGMEVELLQPVSHYSIWWTDKVDLSAQIAIHRGNFIKKQQQLLKVSPPPLCPVVDSWQFICHFLIAQFQ